MLIALQYFPLSSLTNHISEMFLLLTASLRSSNHCPDGWCLVTNLERNELADAMWVWRLRIQLFSDKASQSNFILVNKKAQLSLAPNVDTEVFVSILMVPQYGLLCHRYTIIHRLELPGRAGYGDAVQELVCRKPVLASQLQASWPQQRWTPTIMILRQ